MALSALPVLTDPNVRCARRLRDPETTTIWLASANFETVSDHSSLSISEILRIVSPIASHCAGVELAMTRSISAV